MLSASTAGAAGPQPKPVVRVAIQGERGSNSHLAALQLLDGFTVALEPCRLSANVFDRLLAGEVECAVLPIENSLHGSVAEHYDLLAGGDARGSVRIDRELSLRIHHNLIAAPGVELAAVRRILSHPVALSQCRRFLAGMTHAQPEPFFDTAGAVEHIVTHNLPDAAALAPELAAECYGGAVLARRLEDHALNFTRFHLLRRADMPPLHSGDQPDHEPDKLSLSFSLPHRPGSLLRALATIADAGGDLTLIESRPVPGLPWEYTFFVDVRASGSAAMDALLTALRTQATQVKELGRYRAAM